MAVVAAVCLSTTARADEPAKAQATQAKDPNYRYYNSQWWYWMPQTRHWKVWNGTAWNDYTPGARRSFSYAEDDAVATPSNVAPRATYQNYGGFPNSVRNSQIMGSYGFRSAGSKSSGNY